MKRLCLILLVCVMGVAAQAGTIAAPHVAGDFQGWDATTHPMTETALGSDIWTLSVSGLTAGARHEFKVAEFGWANSIPGSGNSWFFADGAGNVDFTYDGNTYADGWSPATDRIGLSSDPGTWTIVGDLNGWNNADPLTATTPQGGGIYALLGQALAPGTYAWKAVNSGSWDALGADNRSINADNMSVTVAAGETVDFYVDALNGTLKAEVIPEPATMVLLGLGGLAALRRRRA